MRDDESFKVAQYLVSKARKRQKLLDDAVLPHEAVLQIAEAKRAVLSCIRECLIKHPVWVWTFGDDPRPHGSIPHHVRLTFNFDKWSWLPREGDHKYVQARQGFAAADVSVRACDGAAIAEDLGGLIYGHFSGGLSKQVNGFTVNVKASRDKPSEPHLVYNEYFCGTMLDWFVTLNPPHEDDY